MSPRRLRHGLPAALVPAALAALAGVSGLAPGAASAQVTYCIQDVVIQLPPPPPPPRPPSGGQGNSDNGQGTSGGGGCTGSGC